MDKRQVDGLYSSQGAHVCYYFLPSKERKTLGRGCGRLKTPVERRERARRESATADTRGGLANPSGLPMTALLRNYDQSPLPVGGWEKNRDFELFPHLSKSYHCKLRKKNLLCIEFTTFLTGQSLLEPISHFCVLPTNISATGNKTDWYSYTRGALFKEFSRNVLQKKQCAKNWAKSGCEGFC